MDQTEKDMKNLASHIAADERVQELEAEKNRLESKCHELTKRLLHEIYERCRLEGAMEAIRDIDKDGHARCDDYGRARKLAEKALRGEE